MTSATEHVPSFGYYYLLRPWLVLSVGMVITLIGGVLYGRYDQRWGSSANLELAASHLSEMPRQIGAWTLVEEFPLNQPTLEMLECAGYVNRKYINRSTGQTVDVAIIVGPPGPIAVHTPEICFSSRAYEQTQKRQHVELVTATGDPNSFWSVDFSTRNAFADGLRVYYAWGQGTSWLAVESPRFEFASAPLLFKIQLATPLAPSLGKQSKDGGLTFLEELTKSSWKLSSG